MPSTVRLFDAAVAERWDDFVLNSPAATFCHLGGWQRVIEHTFGHHQHSLYAERNGNLVGVLPLFLVRSRWVGAMLVSTPNAVYGGVAANDAEAQQALVGCAKALAEDLRVEYLELRDAGLSRHEPGDAGLLAQDLYVTFDHPLTADEDQLLKSFPRDVRRMIRQGEKHGLVAEAGREELLNEFYQVYATSVRRLGTPVFPKGLFAEFLREFPATSDILLIRQNRRVAAAVLSFYFRDTVMPYYAGAYPEFQRAGVNNFMYWELMRRSAGRGFQCFDFGRSKLGTGSYEFKRGWRMTMRALPYKYFLVRSSRLPNLNPTNPRFKLMIEAWKCLPLSLTKLLGPRIVRNFP